MSEERRKEMKERGSRKGLLTVLLLLIIAGLAGGAFYYYRELSASSKKGRLSRDEDALGGMLPGKTPQEIEDLLNQKVEEGMVNIGIQAEPVFEKNGERGRLGIENIEANRYSFQVTLTLEETGEVLYESGILDPGYYIEYVKLNRSLQAGDYRAAALFTTYSLDESEDEISQAKVRLVLHVLDGSYYK